ncbi:MAG: DmsE family decaheme c-type cytochrome [Acetobacteraceae bacterium]|nr:DmsE family decaheme c-type cytochrome [Acetobacteraceae bacterium]
MRSILKMALLTGFLTIAASIPGMAQTTGASAAPAATPPAQQQAVFAGGGAQTCLKCHSTDAKVVPILQTPHAMQGDKHTPFGQEGCEACHGPSAAHVASRANSPNVLFKGPNKSPVAERNAQCLTCHQAGLRMNWQGSQHQNNDIACNDCHTIHVAKDPVLVKLTQPEKCFTCHSEQRADSFKYSHHPIREGKVVCADCHNPHGSPGPKLLKEFTVNEVCYTCHMEKRGPLLWEHEPVRESCLNCHTPHGSSQARLLIERPPYLCQECHANGGHQDQPFAGQNLPGQLAANLRLMARGCVNCHSQIHGSNSPNGAFLTR